MSIRSVLRIDADRVIRPRPRAATFRELTGALREYLTLVAGMHRKARWIATRYASSEELVLFTCRPLWADLSTMTLQPMPPKECFDNAFKVAADETFTYCEGFALMDGSIPTHHAWVIGPDGKAQDPTWPTIYRANAARQPGKRWSGRAVYMGVSIDREAHLKRIERTGYPNLLAYRDADDLDLLDRGLEALQCDDMKP